MKYLILFLIILSFASCSKDEVFLSKMINNENITFIPKSGGATMRYKLPVDDQINSIKIKYTDAFGKEIIKFGSYVSDSLEITGFNESINNIPIYVAVCNNRDIASEYIQLSFNTLDSGPIAFFNNVDVLPHWNGFQINYECPPNIRGSGQIFYIGISPTTQKADTVFIKSFVLTEGENTILCKTKQINDENTVIIRTEDYRGIFIKEKVWRDIEVYKIEQLSPSDFNFSFANKLQLEKPDNKFGIEYLFDGELLGTEALLHSKMEKYSTFVAGPKAVGEPFTIDFKEMKVPASLRFYAMVSAAIFYDNNGYNTTGYIWDLEYVTKLPNEITIYGSNTPDDEDSWLKIGHHYEDRSSPIENRWINRVWTDRKETMDELINAKPCYLEVEIPASAERYRYIRFVINDVFGSTWAVNGDENTSKFISIHELEVFVKKD